jgi:uroporphyrinogen decarboxylase
MTELERFLAVVRFQPVDYHPLLMAHAVGSVHKGAYDRLHREGLPPEVNDHATWFRYWGCMTWDKAPSIGTDAPGIRTESWQEGDYEFVRSETGAITRQVRDNDLTYSMPEFVEFDVRDRPSWERYRELTTPRRADTDRLEALRAAHAGRTRPLAVHCGGTWGTVRNLMGPERALLALYDDPELVHDILDHLLDGLERFTFPLLRALRPEVITMWEDFCYNHGMLISPHAFREFCAPYYRRVAEVARECGARYLTVDCDGKVDEFVALLEEVGFNGIQPLEQVCGNPVVEYRLRHPRMVFHGGIEKEIVNAGNGDRIEPELAGKVPEMIRAGGCFPMFDHGLQPTIGFAEMCRAMTRLHDLCGSPPGLGKFPRA